MNEERSGLGQVVEESLHASHPQRPGVGGDRHGPHVPLILVDVRAGYAAQVLGQVRGKPLAKAAKLVAIAADGVLAVLVEPQLRHEVREGVPKGDHPSLPGVVLAEAAPPRPHSTPKFLSEWAIPSRTPETPSNRQVGHPARQVRFSGARFTRSLSRCPGRPGPIHSGHGPWRLARTRTPFRASPSWLAGIRGLPAPSRGRAPDGPRSEERRVGKEWRARGSP